jgi:hypothetical protein
LRKPTETDDRVAIDADLAENMDLSMRADLKKDVRGFLSGERKPSQSKAWQLGEGLRKSGVWWCSGVWMLWVAGHYKDAIGILAIASMADANPAVSYDEIWHMLALSTTLSMHTKFDSFEPFRSYYVTGRADIHPLLEPLGEEMKIEEVMHERAVPEFQNYLSRELAKGAWLNLERHAPRIIEAYEWWQHEESRAIVFPFSDVLDAAFAVADANDLDLKEKEVALLTLVSHWLSQIERGSVYTRGYARPIRREFTYVP